MLKIKVTFADAWVEFETEKKREENRKRQVEMCNELHEKVWWNVVVYCNTEENAKQRIFMLKCPEKFHRHP